MELCELKEGSLIDITFAGKRFVAEIIENESSSRILKFKLFYESRWVRISDYYGGMINRNVVYLIPDES